MNILGQLTHVLFVITLGRIASPQAAILECKGHRLVLVDDKLGCHSQFCARFQAFVCLSVWGKGSPQWPSLITSLA